MTQETFTSPLWRSLLFVPAHVGKFYGKAVAARPDAIVLDLEDGVAASAKAQARAAIAEAASACSAGGADILVRVNRPLRWAVRDIEAAVGPAVHALMLPKVESAAHVRLLAEVADSCEAEQGMPRGTTRFYVVMEHVRAYAGMFEMAAAHPRIVAFTCGTEDFTASTGSEPDPDVLLYPKQQGILAARAAGVMPLGLLSSIADFRDLDTLREMARKSSRFGVEGSACIHPAQVPVLNEAFTPTQAQIDKARAVVSAAQAGAQSGLGAVAVEGRMVDEPVVERARRVLSRAARCARRDDPTDRGDR